MALRLLGLLEGKPVKLLIDSGSSSSFLNSKLVSDRMQVHDLPRRLRVRLADDGELLCTQVVPSCTWWSQGYLFSCDLNIIPLGSYDIILGMDWLEFYSPMKVDWVRKFLEIEHQGQVIQLQGLTASNAQRQWASLSDMPSQTVDTSEDHWI
jgi:hypothetical protein